MLKRFLADLHLHTCLSPCAEIDMTPREIVKASVTRGLHMIAITDHNAAENVEAAQRAAKGTGLTVLAGMEVTSSEEVHILALFEDADRALQMQDIIYGHLPSRENDERLYGHQIIVNEDDEVMGFNKRLLITATDLTIRRLLDTIVSLGGLAIACHVDREAFSVLSQLGFIPEDLGFSALEFSPRVSRERGEAMFQALKKFPWVSFSDAHYVKDIGRRTTVFTMREPTFLEIKEALSSADGRSLSWGE
jgi:PHP family Zn ribbon phosphoesterase